MERVDTLASTVATTASAMAKKDGEIDVQLELANARLERPADRLLEEHRSDPLAAVGLGDHEPEVGNVPARRMRIAREREPTHEVRAVLRDEHGCIRMAMDRAEIPALVGHGAPWAGAEDPAPVLSPDALGKIDERVRVAGRGGPNDRHSTTIPTPPRRGSPAASRTPARSAARPARRRRRDSGRPSGSHPTPEEAWRRRRRASLPRGGASCLRHGARGARIASCTCLPRRTCHVTWAIAPASQRSRHSR